MEEPLTTARLLVIDGSLAEAIPHYQFVAAKQPFLPEAWVELGKLLEALDRQDEAAAVYAEGAAATGREVNHLWLRALAEAARGEREAARASLAQATAIEPAPADCWRELGASHLRDGQLTDALDALDRCLAFDAGDVLAIALRHDALLACGYSRAALESLPPPGDPLLVERLLFRKLRAGDETDEVRALLVKLKRCAPERACTAAAAAWLPALRGRTDEAVRLMDAFTRDHPSNPSGWVHAASLLRYVGRAQAALRALNRAVSLDSDRADAWLEACRVGRTVRGVAGEQILAEVRRRFPEHAPLLSAAGTLAAALGKLEDGDALSSAAIALQPSLGVLRVRRGVLLAKAERFADAIAELVRAWELLPVDDARPAARRAAAALAHCHRVTGDDGAAAQWEALLAFRERNAPIRKNSRTALRDVSGAGIGPKQKN